jgi:hypothetical protein
MTASAFTDSPFIITGQVNSGPPSTIELMVPVILTGLSDDVRLLVTGMNSLVEVDNEALYRNTEGTGQLTDAELAKLISAYLQVKHFTA